ncbi:hypothetical protein [Synechococcus phage DSL-LC02]|nr:hypothetical protein [Synechococcus phage DSL-LC02]
MNDWKQEYLSIKKVNKYQQELLEHGPKSLSQSWALNAMHQDWKRLKGIKNENAECKSERKESTEVGERSTH